MRSVQESLFQAAPASMGLPELIEELQTNLGLPGAALATWGVCLQSANVTTVEALCAMTQEEFDKANAGALHSLQVCTVRMCLGSPEMPHKFAPEPRLRLDPDSAESSGNGTDPAEEEEVKVHEVKIGKKGGTTTESAEMLPERRRHLLPGDYHVPPQFDIYASGIPGRNMKALRVLIVQEILEVCGDLYPDANERAVVLGAIEGFCGRPTMGQSLHWDNWKDETTKKKHKGSAISDLEKARARPEEYGVSRRCVPGRLRPSRLKRPDSVPPSAALAGSTPHTQSDKGGKGTSQGGSNFDLETTALDNELVSEEMLQEKVDAMQAKLREVQKLKAEKEKAKKDAQAASRAAANAAKKAAKEAAAKESEEAQGEGEAPVDGQENAGGNQRGSKRGSKRKHGSTESHNDPPPDDSTNDLFGEPVSFEQSEFAKSYKVLPYSTDLFETGQPVAALSKQTNEWVLGSISAVDVKAKLKGGVSVCAVWYKAHAPGERKGRAEFILCHSDKKEEEHQTDYVFISAPPSCAPWRSNRGLWNTSPDSYRVATG